MKMKLDGLCPLLQVFDMKRSLVLYRDVLGFALVESAPPGDDCDWCLLEGHGAALMLNTQYEKTSRPSSPDPGRVAAHGDTSLFFGCRDLDAAYAHLREQGMDVQPPVVREYGMRQLSFNDPDGYNICLQFPADQ